MRSNPISFTKISKATISFVVDTGIYGTLLLAGALTFAGFFSQCSFYCEMASHLRLIYIGLLAVASPVALLTRKRLIAIVAAALLCTNIWAVAGLYGGRPPAIAADENSHQIRIMSINLWGGKNRQFAQAIGEIKRNDPDVIGVSEITWLWLKKLEPALKDYPYRSIELKHGGIAIFSRLPLKDTQIEYFGRKKRPRIMAKCKTGDVYVSLLVVHPFAPLKEFNERNLELTDLSTEVKQLATPVILAGDINCSPWSFYFTQLLEESGLRDSEQGFGAQPSWPAIRNHALIPIDHCLVSNDIQVTNRRIGRNIGSDHLPVIVELRIAAETRKPREISGSRVNSSQICTEFGRPQPF